MDNDEIRLERYFPVNSADDSRRILIIINSIIYRNKSLRNGSESILTHRPTEFPGSHPITLLRKHIKLLVDNDYLVCEKSDGVRLLLLFFSKKGIMYSFFIDRKNIVYSARIWLDIEGNKDKSQEPFEDRIFLFDGEIFNERKNGNKYLKYAIFDTIIYNDESVMECNLIERMDFAVKFLSKYNPKHQFMGIFVKKMLKNYGFCQVYKEIPELHHKNDGLIFTPVGNPYVPGRCNFLFKWKPSSLNTVDFIIKKIENTNYVYNLLCFGKGNKYVDFSIFIDWEGIIIDQKSLLEIEDTVSKTEDYDDNKNHVLDDKNNEIKDKYDSCFIAEKEHNKVHDKKFSVNLQNKKGKDLNEKFQNNAEKNDQTIKSNIESKDSIYLNNQIESTNENNTKRIKIDMCSEAHQLDNGSRYDSLVGEFSFDDSVKTLDLSDHSEISGGWKLHRIRKDKTTPNSFKVVINVLESVKEHILYEELEVHYFKMKSKWEERNKSPSKEINLR